ncbi:haloalkane dehalogenase [Thermodesulfobacteriota bacterium]
MAEHISAAFPYESRFVTVKDSQIHYVEQGQGDPILFVHGNPTSSYLWRNVIPHLTGSGRCIALDLIGMGRSDKPDISYRLFDHVEYFEGFINALGLHRITLVVHDWGGFLGLHYASRNQENIRAIAMMETIVKPMLWKDRSDMFQGLFKRFRSEEGWEMIVKKNMFVEKLLPGSIIRKLTEEEMEHYRAPFRQESARKPVYVFPNEIPIEGKPADVTAAVEVYGKALAQSSIPILLLTFDPGTVIAQPEKDWCRQTFPNLTVKEVGPGIHFVQEDQPAGIGKAIAEWLAGLPA